MNDGTSLHDICETCLNQQEIIKLQTRIIERLSKAAIMDAEIEEEMQKVSQMKQDKNWEI